jgi:hypothetical protein
MRVCFDQRVFARSKDLLPISQAEGLMTIQELTIQEMLWLFQIPLAMDLLLSSFNPNGQLPFADSPLPEAYTSIFLQLWGVDGEGVRSLKCLDVISATTKFPTTWRQQ